jgi:CTP synthase (UTP-ammonia lyase)
MSARRSLSVGLIGDYNAAATAHRAIPVALRLAAEALAIDIRQEWVPTREIRDSARVAALDGLWCVPASPYQNMAGALAAIRFARELGRPFLGTCGGFQHALVEYARNVVGWADADHAETAREARRLVIAPLACALVEVTDTIRLRPGTRIAAAYGASEIREGYHCSYGLNPEFREQLVAGPLRESAGDAAGEVRAVELEGHPFFVATLFQPERAALEGRLPPLVAAFARACGAV